MSFLSTDNILTLGSSTNTTMNIGIASMSLNIGTAGTNANINIGTAGTNPTVNIGMPRSRVSIRGLDPLISSITSDFANYIALASTFTNSTNCFYCLPFDATRNIVIQWGHLSDRAVTTVNFQLFYNEGETPYLFATKYNNGGSAALGIVFVNTSGFQIDSSVGITDEASFNWLAIGIRNR